MDVKDISICPEPACQCCAFERKVNELVEAELAAGRIKDHAMAMVALGHATARSIYNEIKGDRNFEAVAVEGASFSAKVVIKALARLERNDRPMVRQ